MSQKKGFPNYEGYSREEKEERCKAYFDRLVAAFGDSYTLVRSCNKDNSAYLVPKGTEDLVTYEGKPLFSFRISDHWNWKASLAKCPKEGYVQCFTRDLPSFRKRREPGKASMPIWAWQIGYYATDETYHCIYGETYDRKTKEWKWMETDVSDIVRMNTMKRFAHNIVPVIAKGVISDITRPILAGLPEKGEV